MSNKRFVCAVALPCVWLLISCGGGSSSPSGPTLQSIVVTPATATVAAGLTQQYAAAGKYSDGSLQPLGSVTWQTSNTTVAKISSGGLVTTSQEGTITVTATSGSISGSAVLTVGPPNIVTLAVSPQTAAVSAGFTQQFAASATFTDGTSGVVTNAVTWSVSDTTVATISTSGLATTLKLGNVTVTASSGSVQSNAATLTVGPAIPTALNIVPANDHVIIGANPSTKLSAILTYSDNSTSDISSMATWSNTNSFTASVDSSGNVTPARPGYTTVSASNVAFTASTGFTVLAEPRYLYFASGSGALVSRAIIDANSGQPHMAAYVQSGLGNAMGSGNDSVFPCITTDPLNQFLYVETATESGTNGDIIGGEVQTYSIDPVHGALAPVAGSPFSSAPAGCVDFEPTGIYAYVTINIDSSSFLVSYSRDPNTGILTQLNSSYLNGYVPTRAAIDPLGQYLYVGASDDYFATTVGLGFSIDPSTGALTPLTGSPFALSNLGGTFTFHPSGNYVFMANSNGHSIDTYSVARASGLLTSVSTIETCVAPTPVRFSPDGTFAYTTCAGPGTGSLTPSLESFAVGASGSLTHLGSTPMTYLAADLTVDPSGQFLYLSTGAPNILTSSVGANGIAGPVWSTGAQTNPSLNNVVIGGTTPVKHTAKYAYITSTGDNTLSTYDVNADGTLTLQSPSLSLSPSPFSLSMWPWGTDMVSASGGATPNIAFFSLSNSTGTPTSAGTLSNAVTAGGAAIDPSGQFAFETDSTNGVIYTYEKLSTGGWALMTWATTPPTSSFGSGAGAGPIAVDPAGVLVYIANQKAESITGYQYPGVSPYLYNQFLVAVPAEPLQMAIDPNGAFLYVACNDNSLRTFPLAYSGGPSSQLASVTLAGVPSGLTVEPRGQFVYVSGSSGVSAYSVNAQTGALTAVPLNPAITLANTTGIFAEPAGLYLYITTGAQNVPGAVFGYSIQSNGTLTPLTTNPVATPNLPTSMAFSDDIR